MPSPGFECKSSGVWRIVVVIDDVVDINIFTVFMVMTIVNLLLFFVVVVVVVVVVKVAVFGVVFHCD